MMHGDVGVLSPTGLSCEGRSRFFPQLCPSCSLWVPSFLGHGSMMTSSDDQIVQRRSRIVFWEAIFVLFGLLVQSGKLRVEPRIQSVSHLRSVALEM